MMRISIANFATVSWDSNSEKLRVKATFQKDIVLRYNEVIKQFNLWSNILNSNFSDAFGHINSHIANISRLLHPHYRIIFSMSKVPVLPVCADGVIKMPVYKFFHSNDHIEEQFVSIAEDLHSSSIITCWKKV